MRKGLNRCVMQFPQECAARIAGPSAPLASFTTLLTLRIMYWITWRLDTFSPEMDVIPVAQKRSNPHIEIKRNASAG